MRLWIGFGFLAWVVFVVAVCAFMAGGKRRRTPAPEDQIDREWRIMAGDRGGSFHVEREGS